MHWLRNFTIRRVVQVILLAALLVVVLAGAYGSAVLRDLHQRAEARDALNAQLFFLTRAQSGPAGAPQCRPERPARPLFRRVRRTA